MDAMRATDTTQGTDETQWEGHDFSRATLLLTGFGFSRWGLLFRRELDVSTKTLRSLATFKAHPDPDFGELAAHRVRKSLEEEELLVR